MLRRSLSFFSATQRASLCSRLASRPRHLSSPPAPPPAPTHADYLSTLGVQKLEKGSYSIFTSCLYGGVLLSLGGASYAVITGGSPGLQEDNPGLHRLLGGAVFPVGLAMITVAQAELLTSNFFLVAFPLLAHPATPASSAGGRALAYNALRVWSASLAGNFAGSLLVAVACAGTMFSAGPHKRWVAQLAEAKCTQPLPTVFLKAIGANFLVNVAVTMAAHAQTPGGKIAALWGPICVFVVLGLEHSVANMFLIPLGMMCGADVILPEYLLDNLLPVIAGNLVGAVLLAHLQAPLLAPKLVRLALGRGGASKRLG